MFNSFEPADEKAHSLKISELSTSMHFEMLRRSLNMKYLSAPVSAPVSDKLSL